MMLQFHNRWDTRLQQAVRRLLDRGWARGFRCVDRGQSGGRWCHSRVRRLPQSSVVSCRVR